MMNVRQSILTLSCFGLLSTAAMAMPADNIMAEKGSNPATPTDPMNQSPHGISPGTQDTMGSGTQDLGMSPGNQDTMPSGTQDPTKGSGTQGRQSIEGEILSVEGDLYTVKDATGKEVQLHVDESTQQSGKLKEGDQIEAEVTPEGHALKLKKAKGMN